MLVVRIRAFFQKRSWLSVSFPGPSPRCANLNWPLSQSSTPDKWPNCASGDARKEPTNGMADDHG